MNTFFQLVMANIKETFRDKMAIFWFLAFPVLFILLFGFIFSEENMNMNFSIGLVTEDAGEGIFRKVLESVEVFQVHEGSEAEELRSLKEGKRSAVVIPRDPQKIDVYYDATVQTTSQVVLPIIRQIFDEMERQITGRPRIFDIKVQAVQREKLKQIDFLLPGILSMALMQLGLFGSLRLVSLKERKILKNLGATPLNRTALVGSEVLVRLAMALLQTLAITVIGYLVFDVTILGNWFILVSIVLMGAAMFVSLGYLIVSLARTEESALAAIQVVQFPMMFLSGIFFPVTMMPDFMQPIVKTIPLMYLGDALRQIMTGYPGEHLFVTNVSIIAAWLVVTLLLTIRFWRWE